MNAVKTKKLPKTICTTTKALEREYVTGGALSYSMGWVETGLSPYVGSIKTKEGCEGYKKDNVLVRDGAAQYLVVESGCSIKWAEAEERCRVEGERCGYDATDGKVIKRKEKTTITAEGAAVAATEQTVNDCKNSGGTWIANNYDAYCMCEDDSYQVAGRCIKKDVLTSAVEGGAQRSACVNSGGKWTNGVCNCPAVGYEDYMNLNGECVKKTTAL